MTKLTLIVGGAMDCEMPTLEEVLKYAKGNIRKFIIQFASDLPSEQQEEIESSANLRIIEAYKRLDPEMGWKSFVHNHARGAVLDYLKFGRGFQESKWRLRLSDDPNAKYVEKLRERVMLNSEDQENDIDLLAGLNGVATYMKETMPKIRWDLVARMAREDEAIHATAMWLRDHDLEDIGKVFGVGSARVAQLIRAFVDRFDDPDLTQNNAESYWFNQTIYAFGLSEVFGMDDIDESLCVGFSVGWELAPVDLDSFEPKRSSDAHKQTAFNLEEVS